MLVPTLERGGASCGIPRYEVPGVVPRALRDGERFSVDVGS